MSADRGHSPARTGAADEAGARAAGLTDPAAASARAAGRDLAATILALTTAHVTYLDREGRHLFASPGAAAVRRMQPHEMIGRSVSEIARRIPADAFEAARREAVETGEARRGELSFVTDGRTRYFAYTIVPDLGPDGSVVGTVVTAQENTELLERERETWRLEHEVERLSRVHAVLSGINEAIVRVRERDALIAEACRIAVEVGGYELAWIGFLDGEGFIRPAVHAGEDGGYTESLVLTADERDPGGRGPVGMALRCGTPVAIDDVAAFPYLVTREAAMARGYRSIGVFPLKSDGAVVGAFALYSARPAAFAADEVRLFAQLAGDLSFAFDLIESERRRAAAETRLQSTARRYRDLFEKAPLAMWMYETDTLEFLAVNEAAIRIYGYSRDEFLSMTLRDIRPPEDVAALLDEVAAPGDGFRPAGVWRHRTRD